MQDKTSTETERKRETVKKTDVVSAGGLATGAVVGIASAAFVLGLVVATIALLCILRKRLTSLTIVADEQKREQTSIELDADVFRDEEDYEPTAAAENENVYERTTPVPVRDDYVNVNVYDMIKN
ncbi:hypothetical protein NP493_456g00001 [Ridgeia piscesae]|uniref:Uncharacterized protein n=1 Tax=Ridgeia piscesae TaxID=27915 RepID=A0AAD9NRJ3_RIDPI|nr:hypothetical protein NP493_456g00001 [Ridgeia piscesae]